MIVNRHMILWKFIGSLSIRISFIYPNSFIRLHWENESCSWTRVVVLGNVQPCSVFKFIQLHIKWSSWYSLLSDHALWRPQHTYACSSIPLSVLNENEINTITGIDTVSHVEKLPAEYGLSCWNITIWTRFIYSVYWKENCLPPNVYKALVAL